MEPSRAEPTEIAEISGELLRRLKSNEPPIADIDTLSDRRYHDEAELARRKAETRDKLVRDVLERVLPPKVYESVVNGCEETPAVKAALAWLESDRRVLLIRGGVGVGKTVAAGTAVKALVERGRRGISWHRPNDFVSAVLHRYDDDAPPLGGDLVVIDDVGRETKTDFCEALCTFIDDYRARILLSTNDTKERFRSRYDLRLIDRLNEVGTSIGIKGESRRGKDGGF